MSQEVKMDEIDYFSRTEEFTKDLTPTEFERLVCEWLTNTGGVLDSFKVIHQSDVQGFGGEYEIDALAEFEAFGGAIFRLLVECKHYKNPVKREVVLALHAKLQDTGCQKGMLVTTSGYQSGALEYARKHNIATVIVRGAEFVYQTKSAGGKKTVPPWIPAYSGYLVSLEGRSLRHRIVSRDHPDFLNEWLGQLD